MTGADLCRAGLKRLIRLGHDGVRALSCFVDAFFQIEAWACFSD
jgi:hypothetical protein